MQVQAIQWPAPVDPDDVAASAQFAEDTSVVFNWVGGLGGRIAWRDTGDDFYPAVITDAGDISVASGDWIVRLPDVMDQATGKSTGAVRFIVETARDFAQDYQKQQRDLLAGQKDFLKQAEELAKAAEIEEANLPPSERVATTERLGDVINKGGVKPIRDLRSN